MIKLKNKINLIDFLNAAKKCQNDISFLTTEGDCLNLKSQLTEYIFLAVASHEDFLKQGYVQLTNPADLEKIKEFIK